ncbi:hypothetical protein F4781DRAFT_396695 [Annulohypoxylon bovei var. microspora]|nr:hypothetical protein F4781DRAFT_396695 [Annulohypoxylon bovei var. microspora]
MCWTNLEWCHCYECQREFGHREVRIPCVEVENGRPCLRLITKRSVVLGYKTCDGCKEARKAEEICQQKIYRQIPLYYNIEKRRCIREAYW